MIDTVSSAATPTADLYTFAALVVVAGAIKGVLMLFRRWLAGRLSLAVEYDLRNAMYAHLQRLSFGFFDRHQTGQLMSRATVDLQSVRFFLGYGLIFFTQNLVTIVIVAIALVWIDWQLALIAFAVAPVLSIAAFRYSRASHPVLKEVQQRVADVTTQAEENIVGVRVVKAFAQEPRQLRSFAAGTERIFDQAILAARLQAKYVPFMSSLPNLAMAAVVLVGGYRVVHGAPQPGLVLRGERLPAAPRRPAARRSGCGSGSTSARWPRASGSSRCSTTTATSSTGRTREVLGPGPGGIHMEGVRFGYDPDSPVLDGIDIDVPAGSTVALIGPTGCGKTTLTTLIPRFYDIQDGSIELDGQDVRDVTLRSLRGRRRHREPGHLPLLDDRGREHRVRHARGDAGGDRDGGPPGAGPRVHLRPAGWLRDGRRRARPLALGRPAPADRDRPGAPHEPARPHPRRRDGVGRRLDGGPDQAGARAR